MAIAVRSSAVGVQAASGSPVSVTKPTGTASGDILVAIHFLDVFGTVAAMTAPAGWTQTGISYSGTGSCMGKAWYRVADGSEGASFSFGQNDTSVCTVVACSGGNTTTPIDIAASWSQGGSAQTAHVAPSISPTGSASLLLCGFASTCDAVLTYTPASGMTELQDAWAQFALGSVDSLVLSASGATGTKTATCSGTSNNEFTTVSLAIAAAAAGGATSLPPVRSRAYQHVLVR